MTDRDTPLGYYELHAKSLLVLASARSGDQNVQTTLQEAARDISWLGARLRRLLDAVNAERKAAEELHDGSPRETIAAWEKTSIELNQAILDVEGTMAKNEPGKYGHTDFDIIVRLVHGIGWLGIVLDGNGNEKYRTGTHHPSSLDAFKCAHDMAVELERAGVFK